MKYGRLLCVGLVVTCGLLSGCGGGGGGGTSVSNATPAVTVAWPTRSRDLNAPSSALSVRIVIHRTDLSATDVTINGDRNATQAAHPETYTAPTAVPTAGSYSLGATFYAGAGETGQVVGTAAVNVRVSANGALTNPQGGSLGSIAFSASVASASVVTGQVVRVGQQILLTASARDAGNNVLVVSPGSFTFAVVSGSSNLSVTSNGTAQGLAEGTATVTATIDGITSPPADVTVIPAAPEINKLDLGTIDFAYDSRRNIVWATTLSSSPQSPSSVVPIDLATHTLGTAIPLDNQPTVLALSGDGNHLYVGGAQGIVKRLAMPSGAVEATIVLPNTLAPNIMLPVPHTPDTWVVSAGSNGLAVVYDGTTPRESNAAMGHSLAINEAGTRLYGFQRFQSSGSHYSTADISANGLTNATSAVTDIQGFGNRIHWTNGKILTDGGLIANPDTGTGTGQLNFTTIDHVAGVVPVPDSDRVYYASWDPKQVQTFDLPGPDPINSVSLGSISGGLETVTWCGPKRVIIRSFSGSPNTVTIVSGLP